MCIFCFLPLLPPVPPMPIKLDFKPIIESFLRIWLFQIQEHAKAKPDRDQSETEGKERSKKEEDCGEENSQNGIRLGKVKMKTPGLYVHQGGDLYVYLKFIQHYLLFP